MKKIIAMFIACMVLSGCTASSDRKNSDGSISYEVTKYAKTAEYSDENTDIKLELPQNWEYSTLSADENNSELGGLEIKPSDDEDFSVRIKSRSNPVGICTTGVTVSDMNFNDNLSAKVYYEEFQDSKSIWLMFVFDGTDGKITAECTSSHTLMEKYRNELTDIFKTMEIINKN